MGAEVVEQGAGNGSLAHATLVGTDENDSGFGHGTLWITVTDGIGRRRSEGRVSNPRLPVTATPPPPPLPLSPPFLLLGTAVVQA